MVKTGILRGPTLEELAPTDEEMRCFAELEEWGLKSKEMGREFILGVPELEEDEKLALVRRYAPGATWRVRVYDEKNDRFLRCFFDPDTQRHYTYVADGGVYAFNPKTGEEKLIGKHRNN